MTYLGRASRTMLASVKKLPPGHALSVEGSSRTWRW
jgi:hypothetical protein